jgi:hypothetical protein
MNDSSKTPGSSPRSRLWLLAVPLALVTVAVLAASWAFRDHDHPKLETDASYELWIEEAEVAASPADGSNWDADHSAPDLCAVITWQDQKVLTTVTARDGLIARWDPVAVDIPEMVMKGGKADTSTVRRVGRVRAGKDSSVDVGVFDADPTDAVFAGGFRIPLSSLRLGRNRINGNSSLRSVVLRIEDPSNPTAAKPGKSPWVPTETVTELSSPPEPMRGAIRNLLADTLDQAERALRDAEDDIKQKVDDLGKRAETLGREAEGKLKGFLRETLGE